MQTPKLLCPYSKTVINDNNQISSYLRWTSQKKGISPSELRYLIYNQTFGEITNKEKFQNAYSVLKYSLPDFQEKFGMIFAMTLFLIDYHGLEKRGMSSAAKNAVGKHKETNLKRYGVDQTFKVPEFDAKRKKTYLERYGVDNPFKMKNFMKGMEDIFLQKFGCSVKEKRSMESKRAWAEKTPEEREAWIDKSILGEERLKSKTGSLQSKLEISFQKTLLDNGISFSSQFKIKNFVYDVFLPDSNTLVEINGTIWHADPYIYNANDTMPICHRVAKDIWDRDAAKTELAKSKGYNIIHIWERELHLKNDAGVLKLLYDKLQSLYYQTPLQSN